MEKKCHFLRFLIIQIAGILLIFPGKSLADIIWHNYADWDGIWFDRTFIQCQYTGTSACNLWRTCHPNTPPSSNYILENYQYQWPCITSQGQEGYDPRELPHVDSSARIYEVLHRPGAIDQFCLIMDTSSDLLNGKPGKYYGHDIKSQFPVLDTLVQKKAWPYQSRGKLKFAEKGRIPYTQYKSGKKWREYFFIPSNAKTASVLPEFVAENPYFVETTAISFRGEVLKNWLHFRIFLNRSTSDKKERLHNFRYKNGLPEEEFKDKARGRIKAVVMMVKDQDGWPVGDFSQRLPCEKTCNEYGDEDSVYYGSGKDNHVACDFTPWTSTQHPGMFIYDFTKHSKGGKGKKPEELGLNDGVREVHATWKFTQSSCNYVTELHIQTLVFEDLDNLVKIKFWEKFSEWYIYSRSWSPIYQDYIVEWRIRNVEGTWVDHDHIFGWAARYDVIHPAKDSLGAYDPPILKYIHEREYKNDELNCHVKLQDRHGLVKGYAPTGDSARDIPFQGKHTWHLSSWASNWGAKEYYGQHGPDISPWFYDQRKEWQFSFHPRCRIGDQRPPKKEGKLKAYINVRKKLDKIPSAEKYFPTVPRIRCPCPSPPTPPSGLGVTPDPDRIQARLLHATHMCMAFMLLIPIAIIVARFYKETFVFVFCWQEYWWFFWHICFLLLAMLFIFGAILAIERAKHYGYYVISPQEQLYLHTILGAFLIILFVCMIIGGFFRSGYPNRRKWEIGIHWFFGIFIWVFAVVLMFYTAWIPLTGMSCPALHTMIVWLVFLLLIFIILEIDIHLVDSQLKFKPPRSYYPPPVKRLVTREAPRRTFRMGILCLLIVGLIIFQILMVHFIWQSEGVSCYGRWKNESYTDHDYSEYAQYDTEGDGYDEESIGFRKK